MKKWLNLLMLDYKSVLANTYYLTQVDDLVHSDSSKQDRIYRYVTASTASQKELPDWVNRVRKNAFLNVRLRTEMECLHRPSSSGNIVTISIETLNSIYKVAESTIIEALNAHTTRQIINQINYYVTTNPDKVVSPLHILHHVGKHYQLHVQEQVRSGQNQWGPTEYH